MSAKRARVITIAAAGTLTLATAISVAGVTLSTSTAAAGTADAYLTSANDNAAAVRAAHSDNGSTSAQQMVIVSKTQDMRAEHQQEIAAEKAAAARAAKARAAAKAEAARAAKARQRQGKRPGRQGQRSQRPLSSAAVATPSGSPQQIAQAMLSKYGWSSSQFSCLHPLWGHESGWSVTAENPSSGAYGIPQALPGSQMATAGGDWHTNAATQIKWGLTYIQGRYGSPCGAWAHEQADGWY